jgi:hypothetical protein
MTEKALSTNIQVSNSNIRNDKPTGIIQKPAETITRIDDATQKLAERF